MIKIKLSDLLQNLEAGVITPKEAAKGVAERIDALGLPMMPSSWVYEASYAFEAIADQSEVETAAEHFEQAYGEAFLANEDIVTVE
jgi:hypothetical protein